MKKLDTTIKVTSDLDQIRSFFPEENVLTLSQLICVKGGDIGDGGGDVIIIPPKK